MTVAYILNRVSRKLVSSTPYELWTGRKPYLNWLHPWGYAACIHDTCHKYGKLGPRRKKCIFIRYSKNSKGFVFIGEDFHGRITEIESRDVTFLEDQFHVKDDVDKSHHLYEIDEQGNVGTSHQLDENPTVVTNPVSASGSTKELLQPSQLSGRFEIKNEPILIGMILNYEEAFVLKLPVSFFKLKMKLTLLHHKMMMNLKPSTRNLSVLQKKNGRLHWKKKSNP